MERYRKIQDLDVKWCLKGLRLWPVWKRKFLIWNKQTNKTCSICPFFYWFRVLDSSVVYLRIVYRSLKSEYTANIFRVYDIRLVRVATTVVVLGLLMIIKMSSFRLFATMCCSTFSTTSIHIELKHHASKSMEIALEKIFLEVFLNDHDRKNVDLIEKFKSFLSLFFFKKNRFSSEEKSRLFILPLLQFSER